MPPKAPKAKPKVVPRKSAAAKAAEPVEPTENPIDSPDTLPDAPPPPTEPAAESSELKDVTPKTETTEQTSVPPPRGRLESLATSSRSGSSTPGKPAAGKPSLKFKPKLVQRRNAEERQKLEAKFADATPSSSVPTRGSSSSRGPRGGRGGRGRGRGGGGRGGFQDQPLTASGPFALGSIASTGAQKVMAERGHRFQSHTSKLFGSGLSRKFRGRSATATGEGVEGDVKEEESSSDESETERVDVEFISLLDEEDEDADGDAMMDREDHWGAGAPVRIPRREHVDRQAMVNTESSTKKGKAQAAGEKAKEMTFETEIKIKDEDNSDIEMADIPTISPEAKKKVRLSHSPDARRKKAAAGDDSDEDRPTPRRRRRSSASYRKKPIISTTEEKEEYERVEHDRVRMLYELGGEVAALKLADDPELAEADPEVKKAALEAAAKRENEETKDQIFFFQFPSLLPHLVPAPEDGAENSEAIEATTAKDADANGADDNAIKTEPGTAPTIKKEAGTTKKEPATANAKLTKSQLKQKLALLSAPPPPGRIGQLRVHKSGKISFIYGSGEDAYEMEVQRGANCEFLQEVVVIKQESPYGAEDVDDNGKRKGVAYSLGHVKGKYVVNPSFETLIEETREGGRRKRGIKKEAEGGTEGDAMIID